MRCLTLAMQLRHEQAAVEFISRVLPGDLCDLIQAKGFRVHRLPEQIPEVVAGKPLSAFSVEAHADCGLTAEVLRRDGRSVDWLIIDHYGLDVSWERCMRPHVSRIFVIDDLANRPHDCDALLDQNLYENAARRYAGLVPAVCAVFVGPEHALLREEFHAVRSSLHTRDGRVRRILVFFGGSDPTNETTKALEALHKLARTDITIDVVVGGTNLHREAIRELCQQMPNVTYYCQVDRMADLMNAADLAIGAGGSTMWERCYLGLPTLTVVTAKNQLAATQALARAGGAQYLGWFYEVDAGRLAEAIESACADPEALRRMSDRAMQLMGDEIDHSRVSRFILDAGRTIRDVHGMSEGR